jgi:hypothetical protein
MFFQVCHLHLNICTGFLEDNPEGTLSKKKMMEMYQAVLSQEKAKAFVDQIFGKYDMDNSGEIDFKVRNKSSRKCSQSNFLSISRFSLTVYI